MPDQPLAKATPARGKTKAGEVLSNRALNRALLERQMLLQRQTRPAIDVIEWLVGMQAQVPLNPYFGLWSRLEGFQPGELSELILSRKAVRILVMRGTIHLLSARDCLTLYPLVQPLHERVLKSTPFGKGTVGVDTEAVVAAGRAALEEQPHTLKELGKVLAERWPDYSPTNLAYVIHHLLPLVQIPPRGVWGKSMQPTLTTAESWLGRPLDPSPSVDEVVMRYLAAFGPASSGDVRTWSGISGLTEVMERLRPRLRSFRDAAGRELLDLPDAPRPDPDTPAPPRFLPEYDNVFLSHADRSRIVASERRKRLATANGVGPGTFLIDGVISGTWRIKQDSTAAILHLDPLEPVSALDRNALAEEGMRMLAFAAAEAGTHDIQFESQD